MQYQLTPHHVSLDACTGDRSNLEAAFERLLAANVTATSLDLVGLSNQDKLLTIGTWVIDEASRKARALFRELADQRVLPRLGIRHLRLFGCHTASTPRGRQTLAMLADMLEIEVVGTTRLVCAGAALTSPASRMLDLDTLPALPLVAHQRLVTVDESHQILQLVNRTTGAELPRLLARPHHKLALPSYVANAYHHVEILLDFEYIRVAGDLVFPVEDPHALRELVETP